MNLLNLCLLIIYITTLPSEIFSIKNESQIRDACVGIGYLNGLLSMIDNVADALTDLTNLARVKNEIATEKLCGGTPLDSKESDFCIRAEEDCEALLKIGFKKSGVYRIWPRYLNHSVRAYCDMETEGGGWTVFQRRGDYGEPLLNFYETWDVYKKGFGNISKDFWLGNEALFALTNQKNMILRIELEDFENESRYAEYKEFLVRSELQQYQMTVGEYSGNAGDSFTVHSNKSFTTKDGTYHCPKEFKGGWWYAACHEANLNGLYLKGEHKTYATGVNWFKFKGYNYSLKRTEMKIRSQ